MPLIARVLPTLLPLPTPEEMLEATEVHSVAGLLDLAVGYLPRRLFRAPHHTVSEAGLVGGGTSPRPGEVSLAHEGVLFLDELGGFRRGALERLMQALRDGQVTLTHHGERVTFPARPFVVAATTPCSCGWYGHPTRPCTCSPAQRERFWQRMAAAAVTFPIRVTLPVPGTVAAGAAPAPSSAAVRARVTAARELQRERQRLGLVAAPTNDALTRVEIERLGLPNPVTCSVPARAANPRRSSGVPSLALLRVARTVADLAQLA